MRRIVVWLSLFLLVLGDGVWADQITDIGVTRAEMVREFRQLWLAFVFGEEDRLIDGRPRIRGNAIGVQRGYLLSS